MHVNAPWCPFCAKQRPIIAQLITEPKFKDLVVYSVDFDTQKEQLKEFGVQKQSTLIVTGWDHMLEAAIVTASPDWLTDLTTRF